MKPAHQCPDWDDDWIRPGEPEMELCTCVFEPQQELPRIQTTGGGVIGDPPKEQ